jgi:TRAP-type mannitol/chloroaromatic compound transport system permease large subunit
MSHEVLGLAALGVLFAVIFIGFPIAFTLGAVAWVRASLRSDRWCSI